MRLLVTVSRTWKDADTAEHWLREAWLALRSDPYCVLVSGHAGYTDDECDLLLESIWTKYGLPVEPHAANWMGPCGPECALGHRKQNRTGSYCPAAGYRRNQAMVDSGANLCLELRELCGKDRCWRTPKPHWSHGAEDCAERAEAAGIVTWRVPA